MSYIVPGDIPKNCFACPCGYETEGAFIDECLVLKREYEKDADSVRPNWCPLVEVKEPHGRLIDIKSVEDGKFVNAENEYKKWWNGALESVINYAKTIIEAEGSGD